MRPVRFFKKTPPQKRKMGPRAHQKTSVVLFIDRMVTNCLINIGENYIIKIEKSQDKQKKEQFFIKILLHFSKRCDIIFG